jgi:hypothetical protein
MLHCCMRHQNRSPPLSRVQFMATSSLSPPARHYGRDPTEYPDKLAIIINKKDIMFVASNEGRCSPHTHQRTQIVRENETHYARQNTVIDDTQVDRECIDNRTHAHLHRVSRHSHCRGFRRTRRQGLRDRRRLCLLL